MIDRRGLARLALVAAMVAGVSYIASWNSGLPDAVQTAWKGAGVGLLAVHAALRARSTDGWLLTATMALGALGDVLLETHGFTVGGGAFLAGHLAAILLYARNRRPAPARSQAALATLLVPATVATAWLLTGGDVGTAIYALGLSTMAALAWTSRFPRFVVGLGALMFVVSDLLIFARAGGRIPAGFVAGLAVWGLYFLGQFQIARGVAGALDSDPRP